MGVAKGYRDLQKAGLISKAPKVHAVEPFPRMTRVLGGADVRESFPGSSALVSLGGSTVTFQAMEALRITAGTAASVDESEVLRDQIELAHAGLYLELSSASALTGLRKHVRAGTISREARVVLVATSHGYKEEARYEHSIATVSAA